MNKVEYEKRIRELNLEKGKYCIISGGVMLLYGLRKETDDIDIKVLPEYFKELSKTIKFKKSSKYDYLYEISDDIEVAVLEFNKEDVEIIDGIPVESLEKQLEWKIANNREKDKKDIEKIKKYLKNRDRDER